MLPFQVDIDECLNCLRKGELILYPTDTVWGIGCDATNEKAVSKIYELKNRVDSKAMIVLVSHEEMILDIVDQKNLTIFDYIKGIHKPTTVIYQKAKNVASNVIGTDRSIAIRVTKELFSKNLIEQFGKPIVSTSANISGYPTPLNFQDISLDIIEGVQYVVRYNQDVQEPQQPSTIIKWNDNGELEVIRQ
mgnify:CR=1 FL=1|jgi:L-threonylcarbamoyladenylate synthase